MKNFWTAIRDSIHHAPAIVLATICSFGIAILWSSNIGALYPVIDMTLKGESIQSWFEQSIDAGYDKIENLELQAEVARRPAAIALRFTGHEVVAKSDLQESLDKEIRSEQSGIVWRTWGLGWANALLPRDPFRTI